MKVGTISVSVSPGMFSWERSVSFDDGRRTYQMLIDESKIRPDGVISIQVLEEIDDEVVVELPAETVDSGRRVRMPRDKVNYLRIVK